MADERKRLHMQRLSSASARELRSRAANVDEMRQLQALRDCTRDRYKEKLRWANRTSRDGVAGTLSPEKIREIKAQEAARKAEHGQRMKDEKRRALEAFDAVRRDEEERKRALHDAVRRAATCGYGDRRRTAYSGVEFSGTSCYSQSREEGRHGFRHELPSARSPAGRWLREYAQSYVRAKQSSRTASPDGSPMGYRSSESIVTV